METFDKIFASVDWDVKYPLASVSMLPKGVSDHDPLMIKFGDRRQIKDLVFKFENGYLRWIVF
jgi:hypothetical protein